MLTCDAATFADLVFDWVSRSTGCMNSWEDEARCSLYPEACLKIGLEATESGLMIGMGRSRLMGSSRLIPEIVKPLPDGSFAPSA